MSLFLQYNDSAFEWDQITDMFLQNLICHEIWRGKLIPNNKFSKLCKFTRNLPYMKIISQRWCTNRYHMTNSLWEFYEAEADVLSNYEIFSQPHSYLHVPCVNFCDITQPLMSEACSDWLHVKIKILPWLWVMTTTCCRLKHGQIFGQSRKFFISHLKSTCPPSTL